MRRWNSWLQSPTSRGTYCNRQLPSPGAPGGSFNPLPHGAHIATRRNQSTTRSPFELQSPTSRGTYCNQPETQAELALRVVRLQSPTSRGTYCNTSRRAQPRTDIRASIPYLTGHILQRGALERGRGWRLKASIPYLTGHILQPVGPSAAAANGIRSFNPLPHGAHIATNQLAADAGAAVPASIPYLTGHILQLANWRTNPAAERMLQSPTSRGTYCNQVYRLKGETCLYASIPYLTGHILQRRA